MAQLPVYNRQYDFIGFQASNPSDPLPADQISIEYNAIKAVLDAARTNLAKIQRDDGALANKSVGNDQLEVSLRTGINPPTTWSAGTAYSVNDTVIFNDGSRSELWLITTAHTASSAFDDDSDNMRKIADWSTILQAAAQVTFDPAGVSLVATDVQDAIAEVDGRLGKQALFDTRTAVGSAEIESYVVSLRTAGYSAVGDGGGGLYKAVGSEPSHIGKVQSADGQWWELVAEGEGVAVEQFGAVGDGSTGDTAAFQGAIDFLPAGGGRVVLAAADYKVTVANLSVGSKTVTWIGPAKVNAATNRALPGLNIIYSSVGRVIFNKDDAKSDDFAGFEFRRDADYSGATAGVSSNVRVFTKVGASAGDNVTTQPEWALNAVIESASDDVHAVASSGVAKRSADGPVWAGHFQAVDNTNPTVSSTTRAIETNIAADGADVNSLRTVVEILAKNTGESYTGSDNVANGLRIRASSSDFKRGIEIDANGSAKYLDAAIRLNEDGPRGLQSLKAHSTADIQLDGNSAIGLLCTGDYTSGYAIRIPGDQAIAFNAAGNRRMLFDSGANAFSFKNGSTQKAAFQLGGTPGLQIASTKVVGERVTGWGGPTGTAARTTFATFSGQAITDPPTQAEVQNIDDHVVILSERLKALLDDLTTHGLIGS